MYVADAHCDTLTAFRSNPFHSAQAHWNKEKFRKAGGNLQYFAIFTPPDLSGSAALAFAANHVGVFLQNIEDDIIHLEKASYFDPAKLNILLSLEGAAPIINDTANLHAFYKLGIRAMGLTWNHRNFVADGVDEPYGLTSFGKEVIKEMERIGMIIDVSHLNTTGFDDVLAYTEKPFIASHSNSRKILNHPRNLFDGQIDEIVKRGGFIGLNFYSAFIGEDDSDLRHDLLEHIDYMLNRGCENVLGLGADFDGITSCPFDGVQDYPVFENMLRNDLKLSETTIEKIMYRNLTDFTLRML